MFQNVFSTLHSYLVDEEILRHETAVSSQLDHVLTTAIKLLIIFMVICTTQCGVGHDGWIFVPWTRIYYGSGRHIGTVQDHGSSYLGA